MIIEEIQAELEQLARRRQKGPQDIGQLFENGVPAICTIL